MEQTVFALTPAQHHLLAALSLETGKSMAALLDEALEGLRAHTPHTYTNSHTPTSQAPARPAWTADQNQRRCDLVDKEIDGTLSPAEEDELAQLQADMLAYRRHVAPLPLDDLRQLHQQLLRQASAQTTTPR